MKKFKILLLSISFIATSTSCYDDGPINEVTLQGVADITLSVSTNNSVVGEGGSLPFTVTIPSTVDSDVTVEATLSFEGGIVTNTVTVPAGQTTANGSITMQANDGLNKFTGRLVQLSLTGYLSFKYQSWRAFSFLMLHLIL